jgi:cytochrome bd-type quinol oxidase subunit 2
MFKKYPTIRSRIGRLVTPGSLSERAVSIASIVLICGICWLDSKTHSDIRLRILYMFPLAMLALHVRRGRTCFLGFALVASCEATSLVSTHLPFATRFIETLVAITGFLLVVVLARAVRDNYLNLRLRSTTLEVSWLSLKWRSGVLR